MTRDEIVGIASSPLRAQAFSNADAVLRRVFDNGILALPASGLERFNPDYVELRRLGAAGLKAEEIPTSKIATMANIAEAIDAEVAARRLPRPLAAETALIARGFVTENAFFDEAQSRKRLDAVGLRIEPVVRTIARGDHLIRKGFVVTDADLSLLSAALASSSRVNWGKVLGDAGLYCLFCLLSFILLGRKVSGIALDFKELLLVLGTALVFLAGTLALSRFAALDDGIYIAVFLPAALFSLLFAIILGQRFAILYGIVLALIALVATGLDARPFVVVLISAEAGAFVVRKASSRIDLVRAGAALALIEGCVAAIVALPAARSFAAVFEPTLAASVNGFFCGILSLALLPVIEQALNVPTRFRLMELSDLNVPILKRLLTVAPGTYSHSITVAHLAESACREIGADPLLARVGAYYHDIGKIEQPEYFVENQAGYNKHDEINPRLSATVIRSHVKIGVEKARALGLPEAVVAIVGEHHGNSKISYFYNMATKEDPEARPEDFSYPGQPPSSREAAVVMLADVVEAATRTLKNPTPGRLDEFIRELVNEKVKQGQLDRSDLTFRDLETIRGSFGRILAGHFHSRIEYPKMKGES
jgi:putative nucleotidyltransferase with HDIG domain